MAVTLGSSTVVTVFGGSGFIGRYVVQALARAGCRIKVAVRRPELAGHLQPLGSVGQIVPIRANVRDETSVRLAVQGADAVVNLVGILQPSGRQKFQTVQAEGAGRIAGAARAAGARSLVHISAIGADRNAPSNYARTKGLGEAHVSAEFPEAVILRPSIVFGQEDQFFNRFASLGRFAPVMPAIGGKTRFQPVFVGDVAQAVLASLSGRAIEGAIYELGGPGIYTFTEILKFIAIWTQRNFTVIPVPTWAAKAPAAFLQFLPGAPITLDQVRLLQRDNVVSKTAIRDARTLKGLGIEEPRSIEVIVPGYLQRFRPKGEFSSDRLTFA